MPNSETNIPIPINSEIYQSLNVSRETFLVLEKFVTLLLKWNKKINLISRNSESFIWQKHILPSTQLLKYIKMKDPLILDVGSGAGFPGIIIAIIKKHQVILIEKNKKKATFLHEAHNVTNSNIIIENKTIEKTTNFSPDIITSRGVTTISNFLKLTSRLLNNRVKLMLIKGDNCQTEINEALQQDWYFDYEIKPDIHKKSSTIVILSNFKRI